MNSIDRDTVAAKEQALKMATHWRECYYGVYIDRFKLKVTVEKQADLINYLRSELETITEACVVDYGESGPELAIHHEPWQSAVDAIQAEEAPAGWKACGDPS